MQDLDACLRRGAVFIWHTCDVLNDPKVPRKAKYLIIINAFLPDDSLYYLLTTSRVEKLLKGPFAADAVVFPADAYGFFDRETAVNVGTAATNAPLDSKAFRGMYYDGEIGYVGDLTAEDMTRIDSTIKASVRVPRALQRTITAW